MISSQSASRSIVSAAVALSLLGLAGCSRVSDGDQTAVGAKPDKIVVAISVDGLNTNALGALGPSQTPGFERLRKQGATTLRARTARELTITLPNHTGMMTGRRVSGTGGHRVVFNDDNGETLRSTAGHYVAGIFDVAHDRGRSTALYTSKDKFVFLERSWDAEHGARDRVGVDNGRDKLDRFELDEPDRLVTDLVDRLRTDPDDLSFLHLALPDAAGHEYGWMSPEYLEAVRRTDTQILTVLRAIAGDPWLKGHAVVVLTADHGGKPGAKSHSDQTLRLNYRIPFMVWGTGVARGVGLYGLNPARKLPGTSRPSYAGKQPIRNLDVAGLVTSLLGLSSVPGQLPRMEPLKVS